MIKPRTRLPRLALGLAVTAVGCGLVPMSATAALPSDANGFIVDGDRRGAVFTAPDGGRVAFYDVASGGLLGDPVALPVDPSDRSIDRTWRMVSFSDGTLYVARNEGSALRALLTIDASTHAVRVICGRDFATVACPEGGTGGASVQQAGRRWFTVAVSVPSDEDNGVETVESLWGYRLSAGGSSIERASDPQQRAFRRRLGPGVAFSTPLDLGRSVAEPDRRWGYRRQLLERGEVFDSSYRVEVRLARPKDRRTTRIVLHRVGLATPQVSFGRRGMCATVGKRVVLWDRTTRRVWRRPAHIDVGGDVSCTRNRVVLSSGRTANGSPGRIGPAWTWPTLNARAGWAPSGVLRSGQRRTYR